MAALQQGQWTLAETQGRSAVALAPEHPAAHSLLGLALLQLDRIAEALPELEQAAQRDRQNAALAGNLAEAYARAGRHGEALQAFRRALRIAPAHWPHALGAAIAMARQGQHGEAATVLKRLAAQHPQEAVIWHNLGHAQLQSGEPAQAEASLRQALRLSPGDPDALLSLGSALHRQLKFREAASVWRDCISAQPHWPAPRLNLASVLIDDGQPEAAASECEALIKLAPELPEAHRFLGAARSQQGRLAQALDAYRAAVRAAPGDAAAWRSLGGALAECGQLLQALRALCHATELDPDAPSLLRLLGQTDLAQGRFSEGWLHYRRRPAYLGLSQKWPAPQLTQQLPDDVRGRHVLVRREQGLGDELFFLRQLPLLKARGAKVTLVSSAKLAAMLQRGGIADAVINETAAIPAGADFHLFCGDLVHALQPPQCSTASPRKMAPAAALADFPARIAVFHPRPQPSLRLPALPDALARMREALQQAGPPPYTAVTWRAGTAASDQGGADWLLSKEIPLHELGDALRGAPGTLLALQRLPAAGEIAALAAACGRAVADFTAVNEDLEDMLALLELVDDYVGVSNTNMHLRAAAGRTARVLVPNPAEWRWMQWGNRSPWFPGFRIYRQSLGGDWNPALQLLARDLAAAGG